MYDKAELLSGKSIYIGDGVYAKFDGYHIWLSTLEGNQIALEPSVMDNVIILYKTIWGDKPGPDGDV